jgi:septal ring factor EnvC (AmiA/AmiB activator)
MDPVPNGDEPATKRDIERVVELIVQLHQQVDRRFDEVDRRFEAMERRMDRDGDALTSIQGQMAAVTRWADRLDRDNDSILATQAAQQRAIDELAARVTKLEQRQQ